MSILMDPIERDEILATAELIRPHVRETPVFALAAAALGLGGFSLWAKLELLQHAGSFKTRGA
jgi:threonine dehydratase